MAKAIVQLAYRQIINAGSTNGFEKAVWAASYNEFLLKSQAYNQEGKFTTFSQLKANDGRANSLHCKSGFAIVGFIAALKNTMPNVVTTFGKSILFDTHEFEIIESDITNQQMHEVAIIYYSKPLILLEIIGEQLLVAYKDALTNSDDGFVTFMITMQPQLSVATYHHI